MTNAWSLLYGELKMSENFESTYESTIPSGKVTFTGSGVLGGQHENYDDFELPLPNQDYWNEDGISLTGNPSASPDTLVFGGTRLPGGMGDDHISFTGYPYPSYTVNTDTTSNLTNNCPAIPWKYNEEKVVKELLEYIRGTYNQHYSAGDDKIQTLDLIEACGDGEAFCRSNILKYASRYDKKGTARRDIMKILHYAVLLMNFNDKNAKREVYSQ
jgi:hypothetical protein